VRLTCVAGLFRPQMGPCSEPAPGIGRPLFGPVIAKEKAWAWLLPGTNRALSLRHLLKSPF
ncbi:hypothetical protein PanWU01x14_089400, partial [Parasponia andersonii]